MAIEDLQIVVKLLQVFLLLLLPLFGDEDDGVLERDGERVRALGDADVLALVAHIGAEASCAHCHL